MLAGARAPSANERERETFEGRRPAGRAGGRERISERVAAICASVCSGSVTRCCRLSSVQPFLSV